MQPNDQQGYIQPDQNQPAQIPPQPPVAPVLPQPQTPVGPVSPISVASQGPPSPIDPNALQAALNEPSPAQNPASVPQEQFATQSGEEDIEQFDDEDDGDYDEQPVSWVAHEYIHREKGTVWFILFGIVILAFIALSIFTQAWTVTALVIVTAVLVVVFSRRPPRELTYAINDDGLLIDETLHKFTDFKSFGVLHDGEEYSVMLIPTQRFQPGISVYFPEEAGEDIVDELGARLPMKDLKLDFVDRLVRFLRL